MKSAQTEYRADVDGLRAVAVLAVVIFHAFPSLLRGGFVGVDIFFVISGFLITGIIVRDLRAGRFSFARFYAKRVRRIFPALIVVLGTACVAGWFLLVPEDYRSLATHAISGGLFSANLHLWSESGYFDTGAELKPFLHLWSLGVEEQFYAVWPLLLAFAFRSSLRTMLALAGVASFALSVGLVSAYPTADYYSPVTRVWELAVGAWLAIGPGEGAIKHAVHEGRAVLASVSGVALVLFSALAFSSHTPFPGWAAAIPVVGTALVIWAGPASPLNRVLLGNPLMAYLGRISYPFYLWHWPMLVMYRLALQDRGSTAVRGLLVLASVLLAAGTYHFIELKVRFARRAVPGLLLGKAGVLILAAVVVVGQGMPARDGMSRIASAYGQLRWTDWTNEECLQRFPYPYQKPWWFCAVNRPSEPTVVLMGDSHANQLYPGLAGSAEFASQTVLSIGSCAPVDGLRGAAENTGESPCAGNRQQVQSEFIENLVLGNPSIRVAVLSAAWPSFDEQGYEVDYFSRQRVGASFESVSPSDGRSSSLEQLSRGIERRVRFLENRNIVSVVVLGVPRPPYDVRACLERPLAAARETCRFPLGPQLAAQKQFREAMLSLAQRHPTLRLFDPFGVLCREGTCFAKDGDALLFRDSNHLSRNGSERVAAEFVRWASRAVPELTLGGRPAGESARSSAGSAQ